MSRVMFVLACGMATSVLACGSEPEPIEVDTVPLSETIWQVRDYAFEPIGTMAGADEFNLFRPRHAQLTPTGSIVVAVRPPEIREFSLDGRYLGSRGREGDGPGEFRSFSWLRVMPDGRLAVRSQRTLMWLAPDGTELERSTFDLNLNLNTRQDALADGRIVAFESGRLTDSVEGDRAQVVRVPVRLLLFDHEARIEREIATLPGISRRQLGLGWNGAPLGPRPSVAAAGSVVAFSEGSEFVVSFFHVESESRWTVAWDRGLIPATQAMVDGYYAAIDARLGRPPRSPRPEWTVGPPDFVPAIETLIMDDAGCVWAMHYPDWLGGTPSKWDVVDPAGAHLAEVYLDRSFTPHQITSEMILGVTEGELGVPTIVGYSLPPEARSRRCGLQ